MAIISNNQNDLSTRDELEKRSKIYLGDRMESTWQLNTGHFWEDDIDSRMIPKYLELMVVLMTETKNEEVAVWGIRKEDV